MGGIAPDSATTEVRMLDSALGGKLRRMIWDQWGVYSAALRAGNDWLFLPKGFASFVRKPPCRLATYVHDDMVAHYARNHPGSVSRLEEMYFLKSFRASLAYSDIIFTNSEFSRTRILDNARLFGLQEPRVRVCGIGFDHLPSAEPVESEVIVVPMSRWPHKRSALAVEFLKRWQDHEDFGGDVHLIGALPEGVVLPANSNWTLHPRLPDAEYARLMAKARVMVYFSDYEGFGMPPVEAVLGGAAAVYSDIPATTEVMEGTGFSFRNESFESFASEMKGALASTPGTIREWQARLRARHSWEKVANTVADELSTLSD